MSIRFISIALTIIAATLGTLNAASSRRVPQKNADGEARWVEETLKGLSLRERLGQMLMAPVQVEQVTGERLEELKKLLTELGLGGVVVRGGSPETVAALTNELQRASRVPLFVGADYERGLRMQMKSAGTPFTNNMGVAAAGDP